MTGDAKDFDRELGELLQLHRTARGLSAEDVAKELGLLSTQVERYEAGNNRLSVFRFWAIMSILKQDPARVFDQLRERMSPADNRTGDTEQPGIDFMASNRGRKVISALAMCDEPEVLDALADLILAIGVHTRARVRFSGLPGRPPKIPN